MPKSRGRKPKKNRAPASAAPKKRVDIFNTTPQAPPLSTPPPQGPPLATAPSQEQPASNIKQIAKRIATIGLAAIAIVQFAYGFWPSVTIEAGPILDVSDPLATLIRITNSGRVPVRTVRLSCEILPQHIGTQSITPGQEPIASLAASASATRDCVSRINRGAIVIKGLDHHGS